MIEITKHNAKMLKGVLIERIESNDLIADITSEDVSEIVYHGVHGSNVLFFVYNQDEVLTTYGANSWIVTTM